MSWMAPDGRVATYIAPRATTPNTEGPAVLETESGLNWADCHRVAGYYRPDANFLLLIHPHLHPDDVARSTPDKLMLDATALEHASKIAFILQHFLGPAAAYTDVAVQRTFAGKRSRPFPLEWLTREFHPERA